MQSYPSTGFRFSPLWVLILSLLMPAGIKASDFNARDFFTAPAGTHISVSYLPVTRANEFRSPKGNDHRASLSVNALVNRQVFFREFFGVLTTPQFVVPLLDIDVRGPGAAKRTGQTGVGDPQAGGTIFFVNKPESRTFAGWLNLVTLPIGKYNKNNPGASPGNNRWELHSALNYTRGIGEKWVLESALEVQAYGKNDDYLGATLKQDALIRSQSFVSHDFSAATNGALKLVYAEGGRMKLDGAYLADTRQRYVQAGFEFAHQMDKKNNLMLGFYRHFESKNTFLQNDFLVRWVHVF